MITGFVPVLLPRQLSPHRTIHAIPELATALAVPSADGWSQFLVSFTRVLDPVDTPVSRIAVFTDADGNHVGLVSR
jgi:hypothetical protein